MLVAIGSTNPCKIFAVKNVFKRIWPKARFSFFKVDPEVPPEPLSERETIKGAINRAKKAIDKTKADFGVGIEGG